MGRASLWITIGGGERTPDWPMESAVSGLGLGMGLEGRKWVWSASDSVASMDRRGSEKDGFPSGSVSLGFGFAIGLCLGPFGPGFCV